MKTADSFKYFFRKYPFFRVGTILVSILAVLLVISLITYKSRKIPVISSVMPSIGSPGDIMVIYGENFGSLRTTSDYVEVGGSRITASGYISWQDNQIKIVLPSNVQDGLVIVATKAGKSKPGFFANEAGIPVEVPPDTKTTLPVITNASPSSQSIGKLVTITGTNFGTIRGGGKVYFSAGFKEHVPGQNSGEEESFIACSDDNFDFEYWSDSEIHVRVPEGAVSGQVYVQTEKGKSNFFPAEVKFSAGKKTYSSKKTYLIHAGTDIMDSGSKQNTAVTLRVPYPPVFAGQSSARLTECNPEPAFEHYQNTIIHQSLLPKTGDRVKRFEHSFVVEVYSVASSVNAKNVRPFSEKNRILYKNFTASDSLIKSDDEEIVQFAKKIIKKETNPYMQAKMIYDYMIDNFKISEKLRKNGSDPKDLLKKEKGDAYDFAVMYTTILRAVGIPAVPLGGILVDAEMQNKNHWWCEFYIENFGWFPVDVALGAGLEYKSFRPIENPKEFYFGNLDSQHIAFSRGFNELKPSIANSNVVYRDRTYALQSIWEESSDGNVNYSSLWNNPVVEGIY